MPVYPRDLLDSGDQLLELLGTFWSRTFQGRDQLVQYTTGFGRLAATAEDHLDEAARRFSRDTVPILHREDWRVIYVRQSTLGVAQSVDYGNGHTYGDGLDYGDSVTVIAAGATDVVDVAVVTNRLVNPSRTLLAGLDFTCQQADDGTTLLVLRSNPFEDDRWAWRPVYDASGLVVDREIALWLFRPGTDAGYIYRNYGFLLGLNLPSSENYRRFVGAYLDAIVQGASAQRFDAVLASLAGVPVAQGGDTVQTIGQDARGWLVLTDQAVYRLPVTSNPTVTAGEVLEPGQLLCDAVTVDELNRGQVPTGLTSLTVGPELLAGGLGPVTFTSTTTPLVVESDGDGVTKVSFTLGGLSADVAAFWNRVHRNGLASGTTLARLLDVRGPDASTEPTAASLPATVNPLAFLCQNVLRQNGVLVRLRAAAMGPDAIGLTALPLLRRVLPPHTALLVVTE